MPAFPSLPLVLAAACLLAACEAPPATRTAPGTAPAGEAGVLAIGQVQGQGARSPYVGRSVAVEGVVVGAFSQGLGGVFLQSVRDDGDPATAEGLFVLRQPAAEPALRRGDRVRARGVVEEEGRGDATLTRLVGAEIEVLGSGAALPAPVELASAPDSAGDWERFEGMRLRLAGPLAVTGNDSLERYGELAVAFGGRLFQPTELAAPGAAAQAQAADQARRLVWLDDGRNNEDPASIWYLPGGIDDGQPWRAGTGLAGAEGVLDQRHGRYRLQLTAKLEGVTQAPRPAPPRVAGDRRLASLNLLNLFNGDGRGGGFPTARGADTLVRYERQQQKLVAVVQALQPDVLALMEVENDGRGPDSALAQFVAALNAAGPAGDWRYIDRAEAGGDDIRVALVYRETRLRPVGAPAALAEGPFLDRSRVPLAQAFRAGDGPVFVVVANHFKSKGSCDGAGPGEADAGDGQGCWNATRVDSARRLHDWLARDPTGTGSALAVIVGDLNAYGQEDPIRFLREQGWQDALGEGGPRHSYVWNGAAGRLDHALLSPALAGRLRGAAEWHINADENAGFDYRQDRDGDPWRASDHDPLLLGLDLAR